MVSYLSDTIKIQQRVYKQLGREIVQVISHFGKFHVNHAYLDE